MTEPTKETALRQFGWPDTWAWGTGRFGFVPKLEGPNGLIELQKMAETDETIGAMLWVITSTLKQVEWTHVPCVDGKEVAKDDPDYDEAMKWADFADSCHQDMEHTWPDHVEEALTCCWAGFAGCEIVLKQRDGENSRFDDRKWGFEGLYLRDQHTIIDWKFTGRVLTDMVQHTTEGGRVEIPMFKVLHYRLSAVLNRPEGRSMLINAHRPWYLKQRIQESEAVGIDRELCGMPTFRIPTADLNAAAEVDGNGAPTAKALAATARIQAAVQAVTKLRYNQASGLIIPSDVFEDETTGKPGSVRMWDFEIISSAGQRSIDARTAARDYDRAIARVALMQFLHLGDRSGGSYGLSEDQSSLAIRSIKSIGLNIAGEYNRKAIPLLWLVNAAPKKFMPKLVCGDVAAAGIEEIGLFLQRVADAEPLFYEDPALRETALSRAGLGSTRRAMRDLPAVPRPEPKPLAQPGAKQPVKAKSPNGAS